MADIRVDLDQLETLYNNLKTVKNNFASAERFSAEVSTAVGHPGLAHSVQDFADKWSDKRAEMVKSVEDTAKRVDALHDLAYKVSKNITKAEKRYRTTTEALIDYAEALRLAKDLANRSIQQAGPASADIAYWEAKVREYEDDAHRPGPDQATAQHKLQQAKYTLHEFTSHVHAATGSYERAVHDRDYAAEHAMKRIESVVAESRVNDSLLDDLKGFVSGILSSIVQLIKDIAETVVRLLAVVLIVLVAIALLAQLLLLLFGTGAMLLGLVIGSLVLAAIVAYLL